MCSLTFLRSVWSLTRQLVVGKQEWISRATETIFITLYMTLTTTKICYCTYKELFREIMNKNTHTHSLPGFILSMSCLARYVYSTCTRLKAEDINHKKLTFWFAIMHALQPVGLIYFFLLLSVKLKGRRQRGGGVVMWCHQILWLSTFILRRTITRCPADVNVPQRCPRHLLERGRGSEVVAAQGELGIFYLLMLFLVCRVLVKGPVCK